MRNKNMELKEFIKETLVDIIEGIELAQDAVKDKSCIINPLIGTTYNANTGTSNKMSETAVSNVDFEVVLSQVDSTGGKAGLGVMFGGIGLGGQTKTDESNSSVTSIRFSVPIKYTKGEEITHY